VKTLDRIRHSSLACSAQNEGKVVNRNQAFVLPIQFEYLSDLLGLLGDDYQIRVSNVAAY
jgi:hypothetical protein